MGLCRWMPGTTDTKKITYDNVSNWLESILGLVAAGTVVMGGQSRVSANRIIWFFFNTEFTFFPQSKPFICFSEIGNLSAQTHLHQYLSNLNSIVARLSITNMIISSFNAHLITFQQRPVFVPAESQKLSILDVDARLASFLPGMIVYYSPSIIPSKIIKLTSEEPLLKTSGTWQGLFFF